MLYMKSGCMIWGYACVKLGDSLCPQRINVSDEMGPRPSSRLGRYGNYMVTSIAWVPTTSWS